MRIARIKAEGSGYYHVMSRIIERRMRLKGKEKEKFRKLMRTVSEFCGIQIITHSIMTNHWHILLNVPERRVVSDEELIAKLKLVYGKVKVDNISNQLKEYRVTGEDQLAKHLKEKYTYMMFDLSEFMKMLNEASRR